MPVDRIPLNTLAIAFGLAGVAAMWSAWAEQLGLSHAVAVPFWIVAAVAWIWLLVAHTARGARSPQRLVDQLRHPAQGPIAALAPVVGMLLGRELYRFSPVAGTVVVLVFVVVQTGFAAWIVGRWMRGGLELDAVHGGYFLPTVAGSLVAAECTAAIGWRGLAMGAFGVGVLFWVVILTILLLRLATRPALPGPLVPTLAITVAPPAVAGSAWFELDGGRADVVAQALAGILVLMVLLQLALLPLYRRTAFSLGFWSFTFPAAAAVVCLVGWMSLLHGSAPVVISTVALAIVTIGVAAIAVASLVIAARGRRPHQLEDAVRRADEADAPQPRQVG